MIDLLDVSAVQGNIDWARVAAARVHPDVDRRWRGVICKVTEGLGYRDPKRLQNLAGAAAAGLRTGVYHFLKPMDELRSAADGEALGRRIWDAIGDTVPHFRVAIDSEVADKLLTPDQLASRLLWARDGVASYFGRFPLHYTYPSFYAERMRPASPALLMQIADTMPLWLAMYGMGLPWFPQAGNAPKPPFPYDKVTVWQYSGNTKKTPGKWDGLVDGISGDVDRNLFLGTEEAWQDFCGLTGAGGEADAPTVHAMPEHEPRKLDIE